MDSNGGEPYGLGITLDIIKQLKKFLSNDGKAFILTKTPIFNQRWDYLKNQLPYLLEKTSFKCIYHHISDSTNPIQFFEKQLGISGYRNVIIEILNINKLDMQYHKYPYWQRKITLF